MQDPVVLVKNKSCRAIFINGDPNWDDQDLLVKGAVIERAYILDANAEATVSVRWGENPPGEYMLGVIFAEGPNYDYGGDPFYQMSIGQSAEDGKLAVTEAFEPEAGSPHKTKYAVCEREAFSMTMLFTDAQKTA